MFKYILDHTEQSLYWINSDGDIKSANLDGSDVKTINSTNSYNDYFPIRVFGSNIYYVNYMQLVMRHTSQGSIPTVLYTGTSSITGIYVFNTTSM